MGIENPVERARVIAPVVRAAADAIDENGGRTDDVVKALSDAELFWLLVPGELGGGNGDVLQLLSVVEEICAADVSVGWGLMVNMTVTGSCTACCDEAVLGALFENGKPIFAGSLARVGGGEIGPVDGGFRFSGRYQFASGSAQATWVSSTAPVGDRKVSVMLPRERIEFLDNWDVLGLRGTGSRDYVIHDQVVPREFVLETAGGAATPRRGQAVHRLGLPNVSQAAHAGVALGVGRRAFEELTVTIAAEANRPGRTPLTDHHHFLYEAAEVEARYRAARALCVEVFGEAQAAAETGGALPDLLVHRMRQATTYTTRVARDTVEFVYSWSGSRALRTPNALARLLRDVHGVTQHAMVSPHSFVQVASPLLESYGAG
jgi:alkylation response protein AidB-like acyl-CoA dehydrogenase